MRVTKCLAYIFLTILMIYPISSYSEQAESSTLPIEISCDASYLYGKHYDNVVSMLTEWGFSNIVLEPIDDLIFGWLTKDGDVEDVAIDGNNEFMRGNVFAPTSKVVVRYHTFPWDITIPHDSSDYYADGTRYFYDFSWTVETLIEHFRGLGFSNIVVEEWSHNDFYYDKIYRVEIDGDGHFDKGDVFKSSCQVKVFVSAPNTTLTADNCDELEAILTGKNPNHSAFAEKYDGKVIEFDGYISSSYGYNAGIDHVVYVSYGEPNDSSDNPKMRIETEGLSISNRYVYVSPDEMTKVHVVAEVDEYYTDYYKCLHLKAIVLVDQEEWNYGQLLTINTDPYCVNE